MRTEMHLYVYPMAYSKGPHALGAKRPCCGAKQLKNLVLYN